MDLRRVRAWDWIAGIAGAVLIGSLFLDWYSAGAPGSPKVATDAWGAFAVIDVFLLIAGLFGVVLLVANATQRTVAVPQGIANLSFVPALVAALLVVYRAASPPGDGHVGRAAGLWIGLAAALVLLVACWNAMNDKRVRRVRKTRIELIPLPEAD